MFTLFVFTGVFYLNCVSESLSEICNAKRDQVQGMQGIRAGQEEQVCTQP